MVPVVTRAPNITNISCWKIAPKPLVYIDPRILLNYCTFIPGKTIKDWIERYVSNSGIFPKLRCLFHQSIPHCLRFYHCVFAIPNISKIVTFICWFMHMDNLSPYRLHRTSSPFKRLYFTPKQLISHTKKRFFLARYRSPNGPHLFRMVQPIRSPENPGTTVVSIGHLTPWPENPGYRTQVWDNIS